MGAAVICVLIDSPRQRQLGFRCPGCERMHAIRDRGPEPRWQFNGDLERPTFSPSLLIYSPDPDQPGVKRSVCHSFIRDGQIQFLTDSTHALSGKTVPIPPVVVGDDLVGA